MAKFYVICLPSTQTASWEEPDFHIYVQKVYTCMYNKYRKLGVTPTPEMVIVSYANYLALRGCQVNLCGC